MPPANHRLPLPAAPQTETSAAARCHRRAAPGLALGCVGLWRLRHSVAILVGAKALIHNVTLYNILQHYEFVQILMHLKIFYIWSFMRMVKMRPVPYSSIPTEDTP